MKMDFENGILKIKNEYDTKINFAGILLITARQHLADNGGPAQYGLFQLATAPPAQPAAAGGAAR